MKAIDFEQYRRTEAIDLNLKVLVLTRNEKSGKDLHQALGSIGSLNHEVRLYEGARPLAREMTDGLPDVIILELEEHGDEILEDIRRFVETHGRHCEVFVTFGDHDLQLVKQLIRCGVRDVLPLPVNSRDLGIALSGAVARQGGGHEEEPARKGDIVAFMSTRGNTGGSLLAVNVAYQLASRHKHSTVLLDLDIQFGTVASEMDMVQDSGLLEALRHPERIDKVFLDSLVTIHSSGLAVLPSPGDPGQYESLNPDGVIRLISVLKEQYAHVIINLPCHLNEAVEQVFRRARPAYLVTEDSLSTLRNLGMILQHLPARGIPKENLEVVHYRLDKKLKDISDGDLKKIIGGVPLHLVHGDYRLKAKAENEGKAVSELYPDAQLVRDINRITGELSGTHKEQKRGLLGKMFQSA